MNWLSTFVFSFRILAKAVALDVLDLNYFYSSEKMGSLDILPPFNLPRPGMLFRLGSFGCQFIRELRTRRTGSLPHQSQCVLFFATTKNQLDCLQPIIARTKRSLLSGHNVPVALSFPVHWAYLMAIPYLPAVAFRLLWCGPYARRSYRHILHEYWLIYGYYIIAAHWLKGIGPSMVIVANDHDYPCRVLARAARDLSIPVAYTQHASVTAKFPPLAFSYAFLDGLDALRKYAQAGMSATKVYLVGMAKADLFRKFINSSETVKTVGICSNNLDALDPVKALCEYLRAEFPGLRLVLRPHPGDRERWDEWVVMAQEMKIGFSDSRHELSFEFLRGTDAVVVGDSGIILEAALMDVYPIYFDINANCLDHYGFIRNSLTEYHKTPEDVGRKIADLHVHKPSIRHRAKFYCHNIGTAWDGHAADLSADLIERITRVGSGQSTAGWKRVTNCLLEAYEPESTCSQNTVQPYLETHKN